MLEEAYADGIAGAVDAYWNWQQSRSGKRAGKRSGFRGSNARAGMLTGVSHHWRMHASS
jgi:hypothetical protein